MNQGRDLFLFDLHGVAYAVDAALVRETVWLPELFPIEEAPPWIAGAFNLRGAIVPVIDLDLRLGHRRREPRRARTGDQVVVLALDAGRVGLAVSEVRDLLQLPSASLLPPARLDPAGGSPLVAAAAQVGDELVSVLDARALAHGTEGEMWTEPPLPAEELFCYGCTAEEHALFRARARTLRAAGQGGANNPLALAVVELGGERFGIELGSVQEFCKAEALIPLPCCPAHVAGVMSLHGKLVTLLELSAALKLPPPERARSKAVIARLGDAAIGMAIDEVHDVIYVHAEDLQAPPAMPQPQHASEIRAIARYDDRPVAVLDLPALLGRAEWVVDEASDEIRPERLAPLDGSEI